MMRTRAASSSKPPCSPPPYELARRMLNAIGWNGDDFRLRDPVALAIAPEVQRINREANGVLDVTSATGTKPTSEEEGWDEVITRPLPRNGRKGKRS